MRAKELRGALDDDSNGDHGTAAEVGSGILDEGLHGLEGHGDDLLRREVEGHQVDGVGGHLGNSLGDLVLVILFLVFLGDQGKQGVQDGLDELVALDGLLFAVRGNNKRVLN